MTSERQFPNPYDAVLSDLRAKRDQIDQTIKLLESLRGNALPVQAPAAPAAASVSAIKEIAAENANVFVGMTIPDAAKKLLAMRKRALGNVEIAAALQDGGLVMKSADPVNTIGAVMTRRAQQVGDIVKVGRGVWGLKEWGEATTMPSSPSEPEPPFALNLRDPFA